MKRQFFTIFLSFFLGTFFSPTIQAQTCTLTSGACTPCAAGETTTNADLASGTLFNDAGEFSGGTAPVTPNYDNVTNMGTLTLPIGSDAIFAVSGVSDVALPSIINDICFTMDIEVVSGELPFLVEFRLENGQVGQQLQYNAMVDGTGMCSLGGSMSDGVPAGGPATPADFFANNTTGLYTIAVAIAEFSGTGGIQNEAREINFSNISLSTCSPPGVSGCMDPNSATYNPNATIDDGNCQYFYTFSVDTNCPDFQDAPPADQTINMVGLTGPAFGWCGGCNDMTNVAGGIYTITLQLTQGQALEYKYQTHDGAGNWLNQEQLVDDVQAGGTCAPATDGAGFANRQITLPAMDMAYNDVFGSCFPCGSVFGCTDPNASNYDPAATIDDGSCISAMCTSIAGACTPCAAGETTTNADLASGTLFNDAGEFSGGTAPVTPNYDNVTNMGTLTLPVGSDAIFAVSGVSDVALPSIINDICFTMDIEVVSGELPFLVEFRLENGQTGQQLQYNAMADGTGMCSLGGSMSDGVAAGGPATPADFFANNTTGLYTIAVAIAEFSGTGGIQNEAREINFSNISLSTCSPPGVSGCMDPNSATYNPNATIEDGNCQYLYTFNVDTNCPDFQDALPADQTIGMVGLTGPAFGWCGGCNNMTDMGGGVYSITLQLTQGQALEYKYQTHDGAGNWLNQEQLVDDVQAGGTCAPATDGAGFANRQITLPAMDMTYDEVFGSCDACPDACPTSLTLTGTNGGDDSDADNQADNETSGNLTSNQVISATAIVDYDSATDIDLTAGFEVIIGAVFEAFIDGCNDGAGGSNVNEAAVNEY